MTAPKHATIVGGPRDGEEVPIVGREYREPIPARRTYIETDALPPASAEFRIRVYDLHWWWTGSERVPRYVLREQAKGLGAQS